MMRATRGQEGGRSRVTLLAALAAWAIVVPYVGRLVGLVLDVPARLEVADHVIPGLVVLLAAAVLRSVHPSGFPALGAAVVASLAGLWITTTHAGLLADLSAPALLHLSAGPPVAIVAVWILLAGPAPPEPVRAGL